ncbi:MAG TPA: hypothetical protein VIG76_10555 [Amnibacterium sp.]|jgi:hypothetical protein|uniref:hypothetical protein n=1 Tax=Amnibacterium sp. TaxID=1872496 RepID=UPI002F9295AF
MEARLREWLLDADPSIRRQVLRDLVVAPDDAVAAERARIAEAGWGAHLLELQRPDGQWGVGVYDGDDWDSTTDALWILRELGVDPADERVERAIALVAEQVRWESRNGGRPFFDGETEACVNGRVLALGASFGRPSAPLVERLLGEQLADGGWNCEAPPSIRSSFHSTICVLEGLLEYERATGADPAIAAARARGEEYLLERGLLRSRSTGEVIDDEWLVIHVPTYWCYDVLRGLDHLRGAGGRPDARLAEPLEVLRRMRSADGTWSASVHPGRPVVELEPSVDPSRWATLRALRVLAWADAAAS